MRERGEAVHHKRRQADRAGGPLRGIDEQVAKAEKAVAGTTPVKRKRFVQLSGNASGTPRRYRTIEIQAGAHTITSADPLPDDLRAIKGVCPVAG